ncbi:unnamed protein product, partial [marine sediment metagenome]
MSTIRGIRWFILFLFVHFGTAFSQTNDFEIWSSVQFRKDIGTKITLLLQDEFRFNENAARIDEYFTELGIAYSLNKYVEVTAYYRFIREQQPVSVYSNCHRFYDHNNIRSNNSGFIHIVQNNSNQIFIWELPPGKIIYLESDLTKKETEKYINLVEKFI